MDNSDSWGQELAIRDQLLYHRVSLELLQGLLVDIHILEDGK